VPKIVEALDEPTADPSPLIPLPIGWGEGTKQVLRRFTINMALRTEPGRLASRDSAKKEFRKDFIARTEKSFICGA